MPIELRYDLQKNILFATIGEQITRSEFSESLEKIIHSIDYPPDVKVLWDARLVNMPDSDKSFLKDFIEIRKKYPERGKTKLAIVVSTDLSFGMSRMYEAFSGDLPQSIMVFRNPIDGEQWLLKK